MLQHFSISRERERKKERREGEVESCRRKKESRNDWFRVNFNFNSRDMYDRNLTSVCQEKNKISTSTARVRGDEIIAILRMLHHATRQRVIVLQLVSTWPDAAMRDKYR